jgi:hypothetical protein
MFLGGTERGRRRRHQAGVQNVARQAGADGANLQPYSLALMSRFSTGFSDLAEQFESPGAFASRPL